MDEHTTPSPSTREELAVELGIAGAVARGIPRLEIDRTLRHDPALRVTYITQNAHLADALLASPAFARVIREAKAEAWAEEHSKDCMFVDEGCYIHENPYRDQTEESQ